MELQSIAITTGTDELFRRSHHLIAMRCNHAATGRTMNAKRIGTKPRALCALINTRCTNSKPTYMNYKQMFS